MVAELKLDRCSINTATLGHRSPISTVIDMVARAGFGAISPWRRDMVGCDLKAVSRQIKHAGLGVSGYCRSTYFPAVSREEFARNVEDNRRALDDAAQLGAPCFVLVVGSLAGDNKSLGHARHQVEDGIGQLLEHARKVNVSLSIEPLHPMTAADRSCVTSLREALDLCELIDPENVGGVGVAIDVYHVWWDYAVKEQIARAGKNKRIDAFHVCDWLSPTRDLVLDRGMMGDGVVEIRQLRHLVEEAGYTGYVETEIFSNLWWSRPEEEILTVCAQRLLTEC